MRTRSSPFVLLAVGAVALLALVAAADYWRLATTYSRETSDRYGLLNQFSRFRNAAARIPENAIVGYLSDVPFEDLRGRTAFAGTQLAIAPRLLVLPDNARAAEYFLGNYSGRVPLAELIAEARRDHGLTLVEQFDAGVVLYRRAPEAVE